MRPKLLLRRRYQALLMFLVLVTLPTFAQERLPATVLCLASNLPTEVPSGFSALSIRDRLFITTSYSSAEFNIENRSSKTIVALQLVFEYYGANGERFGDVVAQTTAGEIPEDEMVSIARHMSRHGASSGEMRHLVPPHDTAHVGGLGWFAAAACPTRVTLTAALLWFSDGTSLDWSSPESRIDPEAEELYLRDLPVCLVEHNIDRLFLALDLDGNGRLVSARGFPPDAFQQDPCDLTEVEGWKFKPALVDGKPVASKLNVLLRLFDRNNVSQFGVLAVSRREASHPITVIDALAPTDAGRPWHILYADAIPQEPEH
jgi:hypothetical protein